MENILKFSHMLGLSIWLGSMVMWAMFAPKLYKIDPTKNTTNTLRKTFSTLSWSSYSLSLLSGLGIFTIAILGYIFFKQTLAWQAILGLFLIVIGVILVNSFTGKLT